MALTNRMWRLSARPNGDVADEDLSWHEEPVAEPKDGEVVVAVRYLALDPSHRVWMNDVPQAPFGPVAVGSVMRGAGLGTVLESRAPSLPVGTTVSGLLGWQTHAVVKASSLFVHSAAFPFTDEQYLGVVNDVGATAWFGVTELARPAAGETFVVSEAAGAVGSIAAQLAKRAGARVIGICSTEPKRRWLEQELKLDHVIDRLAEDLGPGLDRVCPGGIDVYFDNVGGAILDTCLARLRHRARVVLAGASSQYNAIGRPQGPASFYKILDRSAHVQGFSVMDYVDRWGEAFAELGALVSGGQLTYRLDLIDGLPSAVIGLRRLFSGENMGRMVVRVQQ